MSTNPVIVIRWDLPWRGTNEAQLRGNEIRKTAEWQKRRQELFEKYTAPSLVNQTLGDFDVHLLKDPNLGEFLFDLPDSRFRWTRTTQPADLDTGVVVTEHPERFWFRMDSDDMLAPDTLDLAVRNAEWCRPQNKWVQLWTGAAYHEPTDRWLGWHNPSPPFYGKLSHGMPAFGNHSKVVETANAVGSHLPLFAVVLHDVNLLNSTEAPWCRPMPAPMEAACRERFGAFV